MGRVTNAAAQLVEIAQTVSMSATTILVGLRFAGALRQAATSQALVLVMLSSSFLLTQLRISVSKKATATNQTAGFEPAPIPEAQFSRTYSKRLPKSQLKSIHFTPPPQPASSSHPRHAAPAPASRTPRYNCASPVRSPPAALRPRSRRRRRRLRGRGR
jgi:hypothetical protein